MGKFCRVLVVGVLRSLVLRVRRSFVPLLCGLLLLFNADCSLSMSDLRYDNPRADVIFICDKPLDVPPGIDLWAVNSETGELVTGEDPLELRLFVWGGADKLFQYDPNAPRSSRFKMAPEYGLTCVKRAMAFPDASAVFFKPSSELFRCDCPAKVAETEQRPNPRWLADTAKGKPCCDPPVQQKKQAKKNPPPRVHVCVRPPSVGKDIGQWASSDVKGDLLTSNNKIFAEAVAKANIVFVYDDTALPHSACWFTADPTKLSCPGKPVPKSCSQELRAELLHFASSNSYVEASGATSAPGGGGQTTTTTSTTSTPKKGDGQTTETSSPDGKGPPLTFAESLARNLQYVAALSAGDTSGNAKDPTGSRYGMLGGKNVGGPDFLILQVAAGTFAVIGIPLKSGKEFIQKVTTALSEKKVAGIVDPKVLSKEIAEQLAAEPDKKLVEKAIEAWKAGDKKALEEAVKKLDSFGKAMAPSLNEAAVILPYSRAQIFTRGWGGEFQAHHIFEVNMMAELKIAGADDAPAIILSKAQHEAITAELTKARNELMEAVARRSPDQPLNKVDVWQMYQKVYKKYPSWLEAIKGYFPNVP